MKLFYLLIPLFCAAFLLPGCGPKQRDNRAILILKSNPEKATVTLLKKEVGQTPYGCKIKPGTYLVKVEKEDYAPAWTMIELKPGEKKTVSVNLSPYTGSILFQTKPAGAAVSIDGKFAGETPFVMKNMKFGTYKLLLKLPGHSAQSETLEVSSVRPKKIIRELKTNVGSVEITSVPSDAAISINGTPSGKTPFKANLEQGRYTVAIQRGGYASFTQTVLVNKGKRSVLNATLDPLPGTISLKTTPTGASIRINGKDYGRTPLKINQLQPGPYQVELSAPGYDSMKLSVNLAAGQTAERTVTLYSNTGSLELITYPAGVKIFIDGKEQGSTIVDPANPPTSKVFTVHGLSPGEHKLTLAHKRAKPNTKNIKFEISKGKVERLDNLDMWIANASLKMKDGTVYTGRLVAKLKNGEVKFDLQPGISMNFKPEEIESITPIKYQE